MERGRGDGGASSTRGSVWGRGPSSIDLLLLDTCAADCKNSKEAKDHLETGAHYSASNGNRRVHPAFSARFAHMSCT